MSRKQELKQLAVTGELAQAPFPRACTDRNFGLPTSIYIGFFGLFLAYLAVMAIGFPHPEMVIPMAIFFLFTIAFFVVPALWTRMGPTHDDRALTFRELLAKGIATETGEATGIEAVAQVLTLPILIFAWGVSVTVIAALS